MHEQEIELSIGDVVQIGEYIVTVIDIDDSEASFRVDPVESEQFILEETGGTLPPGK